MHPADTTPGRVYRAKDSSAILHAASVYKRTVVSSTSCGERMERGEMATGNGNGKRETGNNV